MDRDIEVRVYSAAKREARYYGIDNPKDVQHLEDSIRYREFRRQIEPYERQRNHYVSKWLSLQAMPKSLDDMPEDLKKAVALWNEMIAIEAKKFGYTVDGEADANR